MRYYSKSNVTFRKFPASFFFSFYFFLPFMENFTYHFKVCLINYLQSFMVRTGSDECDKIECRATLSWLGPVLASRASEPSNTFPLLPNSTVYWNTGNCELGSIPSPKDWPLSKRTGSTLLNCPTWNNVYKEGWNSEL